MSYGPSLPPHLQKNKAQASDSSSEDEGGDDGSYGPRLPSVPCRGPDPNRPGPSLLTQSQDDQSIGPALPPGFARKSDTDKKQDESESSDDDDMIGPKPPKPGESVDPNDAIAMSLELRAQRMKDKLEGKDKKEEPKRESWMLELPTEKAKNFGLGPRQFSRSNNPKAKQDRSWTETPEQRAKREAGEGAEEDDNATHDEDVLAYMASLKRDQEMEKLSNELKQKRGSESLMDKHAKKLKKKVRTSNDQQYLYFQLMVLVLFRRKRRRKRTSHRNDDRSTGRST